MSTQLEGVNFEKARRRLLALASLLVLSSCGGDSGPPSTPSPPVLAPLTWDGAAATWDKVTWQ